MVIKGFSLLLLHVAPAAIYGNSTPPPALDWVQIGTYTVPAGSLNWCFNPTEYQNELFVPMGDYCTCVVKKWNGTSWSDDFLDDDWGDGCDFENLAYLQVYNSKLYMIDEVDSTGNMGIMVRDGAGNWSISHPYTYTPDPLKEMGAFGAAIWNGKLYTGVNPYPAGTLTIYEHNGTSWTPIKYYYTGEQLRAWSLGTDGTSVYVGIGTRARNNATTLGIERYNGATWTQELSGKAMHSMAYYQGSMYAGGNGPIYKRSSSGNWNIVFNTGQRFVVSMAIINYANGASVLYAGTEDNPRLYWTIDGQNWILEYNFGTDTGACYIGQYQSAPAVSVCYPAQSGKPVKTYLAIPDLSPTPPIIAEVVPDPDSVLANNEYVKQLTLEQGYPPPSWSVVQGPSGTQVDGDGLISGWIPDAGDIGGSFTFEIQATNSEGTDTESWQVKVISLADLDKDDDVDMEDFGYLQACFSGSGMQYQSGCEVADLHPQSSPDSDVDQDDFDVFISCMGGAHKPPGC